MSYVKRHDTVLVSASLGGIDRVPHLPPGRSYDAIFYTDAQTVERSDPAAIASWDLVVTPFLRWSGQTPPHNRCV